MTAYEYIHTDAALALVMCCDEGRDDNVARMVWMMGVGFDDPCRADYGIVRMLMSTMTLSGNRSREMEREIRLFDPLELIRVEWEQILMSTFSNEIAERRMPRTQEFDAFNASFVRLHFEDSKRDGNGWSWSTIKVICDTETNHTGYELFKIETMLGACTLFGHLCYRGTNTLRNAYAVNWEIARDMAEAVKKAIKQDI